MPYGGAGSQMLLSSLAAAVASGRAGPGLAATLNRAGIRYVVVRNDSAQVDRLHTPRSPPGPG